MPYSPLVDTSWLAEHFSDPDLVVADLRGDISQPDAGYSAYVSAHIPGAIFLNLDSDLADRSDLRRGRHPLPDSQTFATMLALKGIGKNTHVVVYDDKMGSIAGRLWWMMRWIGAPNASVLDGGLTKWIAEQRPLESGEDMIKPPTSEPIKPHADFSLMAEHDDVLHVAERNVLLLDARAPERFRGVVEPIDSRAGHIPGALNAPWTDNMSCGDNPVFQSSEYIRRRFESLGVTPSSETICSCGSGVTACHNLLALTLAGFSNIKLYPGSWSEWAARYPRPDDEPRQC